MTSAEFFAFCLALTVLSLSWLIGGGPTVLCCVAAMIVGNIDVSWIDRLDEQPAAVPLTKPARNWHHTEVIDLKPSGRERAIEHAKKRRKTAQLIQFPRRVS